MRKDKIEKARPGHGIKVFVAMSGGVDSSVAAALLKNARLPVDRQGFDVVGIHMRCYNVDGCAEQDAEDARRAAEVLGIPFYVFDFEKEYKKRVVEYMIDGYRRGLTPNPDVECNREIKFGLFLKKALEMGADYVATGHYIKLKTKNLKLKTYSLYQAKDLNKDQSYFLWTLTQEQLKHCLFPIGDYKKPEVRKLAKKFGLLNAEKKDSQGICFLGKVKIADFLEEYIPRRKGEVVTASREVIGQHRGAAFYTIGQRHIGANFQFPRLRRSFGGQAISNFQKDRRPLYVVEKDVKNNTLMVAEGSNNTALYKEEITLKNVNFINPQHPYKLENIGMIVYARARYRQPLAKATLATRDTRQATRDGKYMSHIPCLMSLKFDQPVKFIAPGQSAVFYSKSGEMLGGGIIA